MRNQQMVYFIGDIIFGVFGIAIMMFAVNKYVNNSKLLGKPRIMVYGWHFICFLILGIINLARAVEKIWGKFENILKNDALILALLGVLFIILSLLNRLSLSNTGILIFERFIPWNQVSKITVEKRFGYGVLVIQHSEVVAKRAKQKKSFYPVIRCRSLKEKILGFRAEPD